MPAKSKAQQRFFGAELARKRAGKKTKTSMSEKQMEEFAHTKRKGLPNKVKKEGKEMPIHKKEKHKMPNGHMMTDAEMKRKMGKPKKK